MDRINEIYESLKNNITDRTITTFFFPQKTGKFITLVPENLISGKTTVSSFVTKINITIFIVNIINHRSDNLLDVYNELVRVLESQVLPILKPFEISSDTIEVVMGNNGANDTLGLKVSIVVPKN
jgi:hypothetical protein